MRRTFQLLFGTLLLILLGSAEAKALLSQNHVGDEWRSTPKNRVMGYTEKAPGRFAFCPQLRLELATGYQGGDYETASGQGMFLSPDPLGHDASMSLYDYCGGDPVNHLDPTGRCMEGFESGESGSIGANAPNSAAFNFGFNVGNVFGSYQAADNTLQSEELGMVNPMTYIGAAEQFGGNVGSEYQQYGLGTASAYALTSWNVGAIESAYYNINPVTAQPIGDATARWQLGLSGVAGTTAVVAPIDAGFTSWSSSAAAETTIVNPVPSTLARVIPGEGPFPTLGLPGDSNVFATDPAAIEGMTPSQISQRLGIPPSDTYTVIQFPTPTEGVSTPIFSNKPGFIGGGQTTGGAPEFNIPNGPVPSGATTTVIGSGGGG